MRRVAVVAIATAVGAGLTGWFIAASYLFVATAGLSGLLARPWLAWWLYATNSPDGWTVTLLAASGAIPLVFVAGGAVAVWRVRSAFRRAFPRPLYGDSAWASEAEQRQGSITQTRTPF
jgi:hypothetical protein